MRTQHSDTTRNIRPHAFTVRDTPTSASTPQLAAVRPPLVLLQTEMVHVVWREDQKAEVLGRGARGLRLGRGEEAVVRAPRKSRVGPQELLPGLPRQPPPHVLPLPGPLRYLPSRRARANHLHPPRNPELLPRPRKVPAQLAGGLLAKLPHLLAPSIRDKRQAGGILCRVLRAAEEPPEDDRAARGAAVPPHRGKLAVPRGRVAPVPLQRPRHALPPRRRGHP